METRTYQVYKWDELPEESKEKALERYRYFNVEDGFWYDYDGKTGFTAKELKRMRVKDAPDDLLKYKKIYFDLNRTWYIQFVDAEFTNEEIARKFLRVPRDIWNRTRWTIYNDSRYETNTRLYWEYEDLDGYAIEASPRVTALLDRACEIFSDKIEEALRHLQDVYKYALSDDAIIEAFQINEYNFTLGGRIDS